MQTALAEAQERLLNATATISPLQSELSSVNTNVVSLKTEVTTNITILDLRKADETDFDILSSNLTKMSESVSRRDAVLNTTTELLHVLARTALNQSHYDQLQDGIDMLETSKASQEDFETLLSNFTSLIDSTVRMSDFLQLSAEVDDIDNSTVKKEEFFHLAVNISTLKYDAGLLNITLTSKAGQLEVDNLSSRIANVSATMVKIEDIEMLVVDTLSSLSLNITEYLDLSTAIAELQDELQTFSHNLTISLEAGASQHDLDNLSSIVATLAASKANVTEVTELRENISILADETVTKTTFSDLEQNMSSLNHHIQTLSESVSADFGSLEATMRSLEATKANETIFRALAVELQVINTTKANTTSVKTLHQAVSLLDENSAKKTELEKLSFCLVTLNDTVQHLATTAAQCSGQVYI